MKAHLFILSHDDHSATTPMDPAMPDPKNADQFTTWLRQQQGSTHRLVKYNLCVEDPSNNSGQNGG